MRAIAAGKTSTALLLINLGAYVNARNAEGKTALFHAAQFDKPDVAAALLATRVEVNAQSTPKQETALMRTALRGNLKVTTLLFEANANALLRDWRGCTAWTIAVQAYQDRKLEAILGSSRAKDEQEMLRQLQDESTADEIARHMRASLR